MRVGTGMRARGRQAEAEAEARNLAARYSEALRSGDAVCTYFSEKPATLPAEQILGILAEFRSHFRRSLSENVAFREAEERRRKREEEEQRREKAKAAFCAQKRAQAKARAQGETRERGDTYHDAHPRAWFSLWTRSWRRTPPLLAQPAVPVSVTGSPVLGGGECAAMLAAAKSSQSSDKENQGRSPKNAQHAPAPNTDASSKPALKQLDSAAAVAVTTEELEPSTPPANKPSAGPVVPTSLKLAGSAVKSRMEARVGFASVPDTMMMMPPQVQVRPRMVLKSARTVQEDSSSVRTVPNRCLECCTSV